jgi:hypothetical protein
MVCLKHTFCKDEVAAEIAAERAREKKGSKVEGKGKEELE